MALVNQGACGDEEGGGRRVVSPKEAACTIARRLTEAGHVAYFAGGCVRDLLLNHEPTDYDIATSATPDAIRAIFKSARGVGESFGVMLVHFGGRTIEVATFRREGEYADGRRPTSVQYAGAEEDALRRDFSINGLFQDPRTGEVIDYVGGRGDLEARVLRAIDNPDRRMQEDRLRTLRAARFAARFALTVDAATEAAVVRYSHDLAAVSRERIGGELRRMMEHETRAVAVRYLEKWRLDEACLSESHSEGELTRLSRVATVPFAAALAAWRLDRQGRCPRAGDGKWGRALMLSNREGEDLAEIIATVGSLEGNWMQASVSSQKRLAARETFRASVAVLSAASVDLGAKVNADVAELQASYGGVSPEPFVSGHDLISCGAVAGPHFKEVLNDLYDAQLEGRLTSRAEALVAAQSMVAKAKK